MTNTKSQQFIEQVLALRPRVAIFDADGTLWENNSGEDFLEWSMQHKMASDETAAWMRGRYADYKAGKVDEVTMCGEMVTMYAGRSVTEMEAAAAQFFTEIVEPNLFQEMLELTARLAEQGCQLWAVSSTNEWVVREGVKRFKVPADHVLAGTAAIADGAVTKQLSRMPSGDGKASALRDVVVPRHGRMDAVFGNSIHDAAMLRMAEKGFAVNPNPDLEKMAATYGWTVYWPERIKRVVRQ
jgi:phosphoserine phosphatase